MNTIELMLEASKLAVAVLKGYPQSMAREDALITLRNAIAAGEAELKREPVAIYNGTMDCGETGAFDLTLLKMIPRGAKLYTRSDQ